MESNPDLLEAILIVDNENAVNEIAENGADEKFRRTFNTALAEFVFQKAQSIPPIIA